MKKPVFTGSGTALVTPMRNGNVDYRRLAEYMDFQANSGTSAVILCGTTGENATLSAKEHDSIIEYCTRYNAGRMKILAGVGGNCTSSCVERAIAAEKFGADGILMSTPYYNKTNQQGLIRHFLTVADSVDLPLILYNVPSRTGMSITADSYEKLSHHPNVNGTKEASGDFSLISEVRSRCADTLSIWSGNDDQTLPIMAMGGVGVISVASNIVPNAVRDLCDFCLRGDFLSAERLNRYWQALFRALFMDVNPIPIKTAMDMMGLGAGEPRLPLWKLSDDAFIHLEKCLNRYGLIDPIPLRN